MYDFLIAAFFQDEASYWLKIANFLYICIDSVVMIHYRLCI